MSKSQFEQFEQIFYRLLQEKWGGTVTKQSWGKKNKTIQETIREGLEERGPEYEKEGDYIPSRHFGGPETYFDYIEQFYFKRESLERIFSYHFDSENTPSPGELLGQFNHFKVLQLESVIFLGYSKERLKTFLATMASQFSPAIKLLRIEQHEEGAAEAPEHPVKRKKPGKESDPLIKKRRKIVRKHIKEKKLISTLP